MSSRQLIASLVVLLSLPLLFVFAPRFLPPKHHHHPSSSIIALPDELDDLALFRRATIASLHHHHRHGHGHRRQRRVVVSRLSSSSSNSNPNPKIAFLFLTNSDLFFAPLWERFFRGKHHRFNVYVHADPSAKINVPSTGVFAGRFIAGKKTARASQTLISAARRLLATALLDDPLNHYFALLSQGCVPLHSFDFVYRSLFGSLKPPPEWRRFRYRSFIEILADEPTLPDRYFARGEEVMLPEVPYDEFRVGSQFFILSRKHALMVIGDRRLWRKFRLPCLDADKCYPEEHYFPTLLSMQDPAGCTHYTLTRVNWTGSTGGHPHTYGPPEVSPGLVHELRESNSSYSYFFARKFAPESLKRLMEIADGVLFRD